MSETREHTQGGAYAWFVVGVLILAYTFSYIDRTILTLMVGPIRKTLNISDVQISLLQGLAFAVFYSALGIPIGRLVDRRGRVGIIAAGVATWSVMTALCGAARSFSWMFLARIGVGIGEATLSPAAFSMLADYFPPARLGRALSVFTSAMYAGSGIAMIAGGTLISMVPPATLPVIGHLEAWQLVFMIVGLPGLLVALLVATLREPPRRGIAGVDRPEGPTLSDVWSHLRHKGGAYLNLILGLSLSSLVWNGASSWIPTLFIRNHGWTAGQIGTGYGLILLGFGISGILCGSLLADRLRTRGATDSAIRVSLISSFAMIPPGVIAALAGSATVSLPFFGLFVFAASLPYGNASAALQEITPNRMRGQVSALYMLGINLAGIGLGPTLIALIARWLGGDMMLGHAMAIVIAGGGILSLLVVSRSASPYRVAVEAMRAAG